MLDYFGILTKGGALLWTLQFTSALKHSPVEAINALIRSCLLEERTSDKSFIYRPASGSAQTLKWTFNNGLGLVFVAVYQQTLSLLYIEELLEKAKKEFCDVYQPGVYEYQQFDAIFKKLLETCERRADEAKRALSMQTSDVPAKQPRVNGQSKRNSQKVEAAKVEVNCTVNLVSGLSTKTSITGNSPAESSQESEEDRAGSDEGSAGFDISKKLAKMGKRGPAGPRNARRSNPDSKPKPAAPAAEPKSRTRTNRKWTMPGSSDEDKLDYSEMDNNQLNGISAHTSNADEYADTSTFKSMMDEDEEDLNDASLADLEEDEEDEQASSGKTKSSESDKKGLMSSFISSIATNIVGKSSLSREDLAPALLDMKRKLMERNVAEPIAQQVCDSVGGRLDGQKLSSLTGIKAFVKASFEETLSGILNRRQTDILLDIQAAKARGRPYVIVFCGVNGVGKSTNLAKIAYWLLQHNVKVMIAACDTFRAGAVEQLKTHCMRLKVPLYERGYERDPAKVAFEGIKQAQRDGCDVVLVDTAGRMQDNEPLMRAMSNLISVNDPNLVLFVGEALVGNDAVDQLTKFNRSLMDLAPQSARRKQAIDGIVLTKFDTIDEKVGAALSMVYTSGAPIMFVGCGQTYVDLKKLNVKSVVRSLLN